MLLLFKQDRLELDQAIEGLLIFETIPIRYIDPDMTKILTISKQTNSYAYDAYFLDCAIRHKAPLLTLDNKLKASAQDLNIEVLEWKES